MPLRRPSEALTPLFEANTDYVAQLFAIDEIEPDPDAPKRYNADGKEMRPSNIRWSFAMWDAEACLSDRVAEQILRNDGLDAVMRTMTSESTFFDPTGRLRNGRARELMHALCGKVLSDAEVETLLETETGLPTDLLGDYAIAEMVEYRDRNNAVRVGLGRLRALKPRELKIVQTVLGSGVMDEPPSAEPPRRQDPVDTGPQPPRRATQPRMPGTNGGTSESRSVQPQGHPVPPDDDPGPDIEAQAASVAAEDDDDSDIPF